MAVLRTQTLFLYGSVHREPEDVKVRVLKAAEQGLTRQVRGLA